MKFEEITKYIKRPLKERQSHLQLQQSCIEIGGSNSGEFRGLAAHFLKTTIPTHKKVVLCHACHNWKCSNVYHIYWGTYKENSQDAVKSGVSRGYYYSLLKKYSPRKVRELMVRAGKRGGAAMRRKARLKRITIK